MASQQLDDILDLDPNQFEILVSELISNDEDLDRRYTALNKFEKLIFQLNSDDRDQVSRSRAFFHQTLRSRPDSLLLALCKLLSLSLPWVRAKAAKHIGEIFTTTTANFLSTTLDTLKLNFLSALYNETNSNVKNSLLRVICDFYATERWPELLQDLFKCVNSQNFYLQELAFLVFKSLVENLKENTSLIIHLNTFQEIFLKYLDNRSNWDVKIAALDTSINFVQFISNQNDPNKFDYLLPLMISPLTEALNLELESKTEDCLHLLIKLAETNPRFFERQLEKVLLLMLKITVDDTSDVNIKNWAIEFLIALVEKAPSMIRKEPQFIKRFFDELMYMLFDIESVEADAADFADAAAVGVAVCAITDAFDNLVKTSRAAAAAAADAAADAAAAAAAAAASHDAVSVVIASHAANVAAHADAAVVTAADTVVESFPSAIAAADNDEDGDGDEVDHIWESNNCILGKECLSKLSILLGEKMIFQRVLRLFSHLSGNSIWQQRHAVLIAIPIIARGCHKAMLENLDEVVTKLLKSFDDSHPCVRLAAINAIRQLSVLLRTKLQEQYHDIILITLFKVMNDPQGPKLQAAATTAVLIFLTNGTPKIIDLYKWRIIDEFSKVMRLMEVESLIKGNFLRSALVKILSILSRDISGRWTQELREKYLSLTNQLKTARKKSELNAAKVLKIIDDAFGSENDAAILKFSPNHF